MRQELGDDVEGVLLGRLWERIAENNNNTIRGVWKIREELPLTRFFNGTEYETANDDPVVVPLKDGGEFWVGLSFDVQDDNGRTSRGLKFGLKFTSNKGDELVDNEYQVFEKASRDGKDDFWIFWDDDTDSTQNEKMKDLARFDPKRDIDWEKVKEGSLEEKVAEGLCKYGK